MHDFFKQQAEWLKTWQEQQQTLTKQYAAWGEGLAQGAPGDFSQQVPGNFEELVKAQQELFEQFTGFGQQMQQNLQQLWGDKLPEELLRQFNFNLLQEFYKSWLGNMKFPGGLSNPFMPGQNWTDPTSFLNDFMKNEHPFFSTFSNFNMADEVQKVFGMFGMLQGSKMPGGDLFSQLSPPIRAFSTSWPTPGQARVLTSCSRPSTTGRISQTNTCSLRKLVSTVKRRRIFPRSSAFRWPILSLSPRWAS